MPDLVRFESRPNGQLVRGLLQGAMLAVFIFGSISCTSRSGGPSNSTSANSPEASPVAQAAQPEAAAPRKVFESGEAVPAGYLGYKVLGSWFSDQASEKKQQSGAGSYLYVDLAIVNTDKKERPVPQMKLFDETGKEYALNAQAGSVERSLAQVTRVEPNQSKRATAIFEAPKGHQYILKIPGFSQTDEVQIKLAPAAAPPSR